jgi:HlyD family secretion protein
MNMIRSVLLATALPLLLAGCFGSGERTLQGYVEGTYIYVSAESAGRVVARPAAAGSRVNAGDVLFSLDDADQKAAVAGAEARLAQARAQLANLQTGKRDEEVAVLAAAVSSARTTFQNTQDDYRRKLQLFAKGVVPQSAVDVAKTATDTAQAQVDSTERQLQVSRLPARPEEIEASERNVAAQEAALEQAKIQLDRRQIKAPAAGLVEETFYEPGELVATSQPVVSLLPDANRKVRFFLPEPLLATVKPGMTIAIGCDGCTTGLQAEIELVSTAAEFTPPIIYSKDSRDKLVFRVDAKPLGAAADLKVGQPLDISLPLTGTGG